MNGPFSNWYGTVKDREGNDIVRAAGEDDEAETRNAEMTIAALNAVFYAAVATGQIKGHE
jgi:hypothetical protein